MGGHPGVGGSASADAGREPKRATNPQGSRRPQQHWFAPLADHMGETYLRYSFTKGTEQEVGFLIDLLGLGPSCRVLDAGCGPGRHLRALTARGVPTVGMDLAESFCRLVVEGDPPAPVAVADIRALPVCAGFDAVLSLCQGGFGLLGGPGAPLDADVVAVGQLAAALKPGGRLVLSAFSSYFQVRHQVGDAGEHDDEPGGDFDAEAGVMHEQTTVKDAAGTDLPADLWTTGYTPRELRFLSRLAGLEPEHVWSVDPGDYARRNPDLDHTEFLLVARRPE